MTVVLAAVTPNGVVVPSVIGDKLSLLTNLTFSSTYKTGGDATLAAAIESIFGEIGRGQIEYINVNGANTHYPIYDYVNNKLQWIVASTGVELAEAAYPAGITGRTVRLYAIGK